MRKEMLLVCFVPYSFGILKAQVHQLPKLNIPRGKICMVIGVKSGENFALVYNGDTLASYTSTENTSVSQFFDETISYKNYGDSVEIGYEFPRGDTFYRLHLPDSTLLFASWLRSGIDIAETVRYRTEGSDKYEIVKNSAFKKVTHKSAKFKSTVPYKYPYSK